MVAKNASNQVGDSASGGPSNNISEDWTRFGKKQILSIGTKRQRIHQADDDEDDVDFLAGRGGGDQSSSDEDEGGRTSAVKDKKKRKVVPPIQPPVVTPISPGANESSIGDTGKKKKKKKKGKKERAAEKTNEDATFPAKNDVAVDAQIAKVEDSKTTTPSTSEETKNEPSSNAADKHADKTNNNNNSNKRKRKKVRSRQKNIRKDHRATEEKPSHLIVGNTEYTGRPLTEATRKKLGLEVVSTSKKKTKKSAAANAAFDSGKWVGEDDEGGDANEGEAEVTTGADVKGDSDVAVKDVGENVVGSKSSKSEDNMTLTKIGDCIVGSGDAATNKPLDDAENELGDVVADKDSKKKKKSKKKQKRKFKNLVVG